MFLTLVLVVVLAKSSQAQVTTTKVKSGVFTPIGFIRHTDLCVYELLGK